MKSFRTVFVLLFLLLGNSFVCGRISLAANPGLWSKVKLNLIEKSPSPAPATSNPRVFGPLELSVCKDSDGGKNYDVKGTTTSEGRGQANETSTDSCYDPRVGVVNSCNGESCALEEYFCENDHLFLDLNYRACPNGCFEGRCAPASVAKGSVPIFHVRATYFTSDHHSPNGSSDNFYTANSWPLPCGTGDSCISAGEIVEIPFRAYTSKVDPALIPVYQLSLGHPELDPWTNQNTYIYDDHIFTSDLNEVGKAQTNLNYAVDTPTAFWVYPTQVPGTVLLHRLSNVVNYGDPTKQLIRIPTHLYTADEEFAKLLSEKYGWTDETATTSPMYVVPQTTAQ